MSKLCDECETVAHCMKHGCIPKQQALDKMAENARELGLDYEPAQQEPVAHRDGFWCADLTCKKCYSADFRFKHKNSVVNESLTTPAQYGWTTKQIAGMARLKEAQDKKLSQRTWVGLTDEEITDMWAESSPYYHEDDFAKAIEAKLRSKNEDRN